MVKIEMSLCSALNRSTTTDAILFLWKIKLNKDQSTLRQRMILTSQIQLFTKNLKFSRTKKKTVLPNHALSINLWTKPIRGSSKALTELILVLDIWLILTLTELATKKSYKHYKQKSGSTKILELFKFSGQFALHGVKHSLRFKLVSNSQDMGWSPITCSVSRVFSFTRTLNWIDLSSLFTLSFFCIAFCTSLRFYSNFNLESAELLISLSWLISAQCWL
jgi:hypothetical protein